VNLLDRARVGVLLLLLLVPQSAWAQGARLWDETALWAEFIYTLRSWEKGVWVITPAFRTDEQEINSTFMTRVSTDATFALPREWEVRGRFSLIGHGTEFDDVVFDKRIQILFRRTFFRNDDLRLLAGLFYERHFRGDAIPDFNVYRTRLEFRGDGFRNQPWAQQDLFFDHARSFFRSRTRVGLLWNLRSSRQLRLAYQFQYTQDRTGVWGPQHAIVVRYWFGERLSWRAVN